MPYEMNPHFTGRDHLLTLLSEKLRDATPQRYNHRVAVYGMGGVGKTQLAIEYVYRSRGNYHSIFWISSADQAALLSGFQDIARMTGCLPDLAGSNLTPSEVAKAVLSWLQQREGWLLIMDNMDDIDVAVDYLPKMTQGGHTLVTTRNPNHLSIPAEGLEIPVLDKEGAIKLLILRSQIDCTDDPSVTTHASEIVKKLGYLALAIEQAAAFIRSSVNGMVEFLAIYHKSRQRFLQRNLPKSHPYSNSLAATFLVSYNKVHDDPNYGKQATTLLRLLAFLNPDGILVDFLRSGSQGLDDAFRQVIEDEIVFHDALELLQRYSLVTLSQQNDAIIIHRLVQAVIKDELDVNELQTFRENIISVCSLVFPFVDDTMTMTDRMKCRRLQSQVLEPAIMAAEVSSVPVLFLLYKIGTFLLDDGKFQDSERVIRLSVEISTKLFSAEHPDTLVAMSWLAETFRRSGKWDQAAGLNEQVLEGRKRAVGEGHQDTLTAMSSLALTYRFQGNINRAKTMFNMVLEARKRIQGEDHYDTLTSMFYLALTLSDQGELDQAVAMVARVWEARKRLLGGEHPQTLSAMADLAYLWIQVGKYTEAEVMGKKVLEAKKRILGEAHTDTLVSMGILAGALKSQGKLSEAMTLEEKLLETSRQILGDEHPETLIGMNNLAMTLWYQGKRDEAGAMGQKVLETKIRVMGAEHPDTLISMENQAYVYNSLGRRLEARELIQKAVDESRIVLGEDHPHTLDRIQMLNSWLGIFNSSCQACLIVR